MWRVNGLGFSLGILGGLLASIIKFAVFQGAAEYVVFLLVLSVSAIGVILGSLISPPTDIRVLRRFYCLVRPPGFWGPVIETLEIDSVCVFVTFLSMFLLVTRLFPLIKEKSSKIRVENTRDLLVAIFVAVPFQVSLFCSLMSLVVGNWIQFLVFLVVCVASAVMLYFFWWRYIEEEVKLEISDKVEETETEDESSKLMNSGSLNNIDAPVVKNETN